MSLSLPRWAEDVRCQRWPGVIEKAFESRSIFRPDGRNGAKDPRRGELQSGFPPKGRPAMERVSDMDDVVSPENGAQEKPELALDLNFIPN